MIRDVKAFRAALEIGRKAASEGKLVTFGVVPNKPETGYGYIKRVNGAGPAYAIDRFVEKPDLATAKTYVESKEYFWNSGMFLFRASAVLGELRELAPKIYEACAQAITAAKRDLDFTRLPTKEFGACPSDSFDYAVMEKTKLGVVVPLDAGWSDVGSWSALHEAIPADGDGNVALGDVLTADSHGNYLHSTSRLVRGRRLAGSRRGRDQGRGAGRAQEPRAGREGTGQSVEEAGPLRNFLASGSVSAVGQLRQHR